MYKKQKVQFTQIQRHLKRTADKTCVKLKAPPSPRSQTPNPKPQPQSIYKHHPGTNPFGTMVLFPIWRIMSYNVQFQYWTIRINPHFCRVIAILLTSSRLGVSSGLFCMNIRVNGLPVLSSTLVHVRATFSFAPGVHWSSKFGHGLQSSHLWITRSSQLGPRWHGSQGTGFGMLFGCM